MTRVPRKKASERGQTRERERERPEAQKERENRRITPIHFIHLDRKIGQTSKKRREPPAHTHTHTHIYIYTHTEPPNQPVKKLYGPKMKRTCHEWREKVKKKSMRSSSNQRRRREETCIHQCARGRQT